MNSTSGPVSQLLPIHLFENLRTFASFEVSSLALLVFDYAVTFTDEVELVWNRQWSLCTTLFYLTRYLPFIDCALTIVGSFAINLSPSTCIILYQIKSWLYVLGIFIADAILIVRTYAIWDRNKFVGWFLSLFMIGDAVLVGVFLQKLVNTIVFGESPSPSALPGCFFVKAGNQLWLCYLFLIVFETVILILTLIKLVYQRKYLSSSLINVIYRDGITFYAYLFAFSAINIAVFNLAPPELAASLSGAHRVLHAILSGRLIMNIRRAALRRNADWRLEASMADWVSDQTSKPIQLVSLGRSITGTRRYHD